MDGRRGDMGWEGSGSREKKFIGSIIIGMWSATQEHKSIKDTGCTKPGRKEETRWRK